jgi:hypothetical protein
MSLNLSPNIRSWLYAVLLAVAALLLDQLPAGAEKVARTESAGSGYQLAAVGEEGAAAPARITGVRE